MSLVNHPKYKISLFPNDVVEDGVALERIVDVVHLHVQGEVAVPLALADFDGDQAGYKKKRFSLV